MMRFWESLVLKGRFQSVCYFLPERGQSYLPCDRHFSIIEKNLENSDNVCSGTSWNCASRIEDTCVDKVTKPLTQLYIGPYQVLSKTEKYFKIMQRDTQSRIDMKVNIDRLKPACYAATSPKSQRCIGPTNISHGTRRHEAPGQRNVPMTSIDPRKIGFHFI
ncbi:unnamed protein product [Pieris macdunnoughi]|uniref:Uncharacterized protein n=1 Tax=Pieris macdunnoughi TaxID=345717 RepID=A0A821XCL1_9NEOP|nr:unnamed protein product [Pieris macdunnoughi]